MRVPRAFKPTPLNQSLARYSSAIVISAVILAAARAATQYWDADATATGNTPSGTNLGGTGPWDSATSGNWWNGTADTTWGSGNDAVFTGTPGVVTIAASGVTATNVAFQTSGYTLGNLPGGTLTLASGGTVSLSNRLGTPVTTTINAPIVAASGFRFVGNGGTLTVNGTQSGIATGAGAAVTLHSGTIALAGAATKLASTAGLTFRGTSTFSMDNAGEAGASTAYTYGALNALAGDGNVNITRTLNKNVTASFTGFTRSPGATMLFTDNGNSSALGTNAKFTITGAGALFMPGAFVAENGNSASFAVYDTATNSVKAIVYSGANQTISGTNNFFGLNRHFQLIGDATNQGVANATSNIQSVSITAQNNLSLVANATVSISADTAGGANTGPGSILKTGGSLNNGVVSNSTISAVSGTATLAAGGTGEMIIRTDDALDTLNLASSIVLNGSALTKSGNGTLVISGTNNITGTTYVNAGTLRINATAALNSGKPVQLSGGTYEVQLGGNNSTTETFAKGLLTVTSSSALVLGNTANTAASNKTETFTGISIGSHTLTVSPTAGYSVNVPAGGAGVTLSDSLPSTFQINGTQTAASPGMVVGDVVQNGGGGVTPGIIKAGTGYLALTGANSFGGAGASVEVQGGVLSINSDTALGNPANRIVLNTTSATEGLYASANVNTSRSLLLANTSSGIEMPSGVTVTLGGQITSNGVVSLAKRGAGTLVLGNATNNFGGAGSTLDFQQGVLEVSVGDVGGNGAIGTLGNIRIGTTGTLGAGDEFRISAPAASAVATGANVQLSSATGTAVNKINVVNAGTTLTVNGIVSGLDTKSNLTKVGLGNLELTNPLNSFGGAGSNTTLEIANGSLIVSSGGALGDPTNTVKLSMTGVNDRFRATGTSAARQNFVLAGTSSGTIFDVDAGKVFTINGVISNLNATNLIKAGSGTLVLGGANTFGGAGANKTIDIQAGVLAAGSLASLGDVSNSINLSATTAGQGFLATGTYSLEGARLVKLVNDGTGVNTSTIGVTQGNSLTLTSAFNLPTSASAALLKNDLGNLNLTAAQAGWNGALTVSGGAVRLVTGSANLLGSTTGGTTIKDLGSLEFVGNNTFTLAGEPLTISPSGDNTVMVGSNYGGAIRSGAGTTATTTISGASITINGVQTTGNSRGVLIGSDANATLTISSPITVTGAATAGNFNLLLGGESTADNTLGSTITNSQSGANVNLVKTGGGTWVLSTPQTAVKAVTINNGTFKVNAVADGVSAGSGNILAGSPNLTFLGGGSLTSNLAAADGGGRFLYDNTGVSTTGTVTKTQALGAISFAAGDGRVEINHAVAQNAFLTTTGITRSPGATGTYFAFGSATTNANTRLTINGGTAGYFNPGIFAAYSVVNATGFGWYDTTNLTLRAITYSAAGGDGGSAYTYAAGASLVGGRYTQITGAGTTTVPSSLALNSLHITGASTLTVASGALTIDAGGTFAAGAILKTGGSASSITGPGSLGAGAGKELIVRPDQTTDSVAISAPITNTAILTKSGLGTLTLSGSNSWSGATYVNGGTFAVQGPGVLGGNGTVNLAGGSSLLPTTFAYSANGDGTSSPETLTITSNNGIVSTNPVNLSFNGNGILSLGRLSGLAQNKTVAFNNLSVGSQTFAVTLANGYTARFNGQTTLTDNIPATFNIGGTQGSNLAAGLALVGQITSTNPVGLIKTGSGTLDLGSSALSNFGGLGAVIDIQDGILAAGSDAALGNALNGILLNANSATKGFRANGTFSTGRTFTIAQSSTALEVTEGNVFTLNSAFNLGSAGGATASLAKNDNGVLELGADQVSNWTGAVTINAGAIRLKTGGALGATSAGKITLASSPGIALQLSGNNTIYSPYLLSLSSQGINGGGALENVSGNNTWSGAITLPTTGGATIGSSSGTLNLTSAITATNAGTLLTLAGAGNINVPTALPANVNVTKVGSGNLTLSAVNTAYTGNITVNAGTLTVAGTGAALGGTGTLAVTPGATLTVNDSGTPVNNRLGKRVVTFTGGNFNLIGSTSGNTLETITASTGTFARGLTTITLTADSARTTQLDFTGVINNIAGAQNGATLPNAATVLFRGTNLGQPLNDKTVAHNPIPGVAGVTISAVNPNANPPTQLVTFNGQNGAVGTTTKGILPWALVDSDPVNGVGTSFATFDLASMGRDRGVPVAGVNPLRALDPALEMTSSLITGANANLNLSTTANLTATTFNPATQNFAPNFNSITLQSGGGIAIDSSQGIVFMTLSSGGLLARTGNTGISGGVLNAPAGNSPLNIWTPGNSSLVISSTLNGGNGATTTGLVKSGAGTLTLSTPISSAFAGMSANSFNALTAINQGTLKLNGGTNTLFPNAFVNISPGATLDLNGNAQYVQSLFTDGTVTGAGGTVTSSSGTGTLALNTDSARTFAGSMIGSVNFLRSGVSNGTYSLVSPNTYTGTTQLSAGSTILRDAGTMANTSSLQVNFAALTLDNTGTLTSSNRVNNSAPITLQGGAINLLGRPLSTVTEVLGALTVAQGLSSLTANASSGVAIGANVASAELNFASLSRQSGAILNFVGQANGTGVNLGGLGSNPRITFNTAPSLTAQNLIGPWAITTGVSVLPEFATYTPGLGIGPLGGVGFAAYDTAATLSVGTSTQNLRLNASQALSANATVNSLNLTGNFSPGISFTNDAVLNLVSGGLIRSGTTGGSTIGAAAVGNQGKLTSGGSGVTASELVIYQGKSNQNLQIFSQIINNGSGGTTALVLGGTGGTIQLAPQVSNTYSGGTTINGNAGSGTLTLPVLNTTTTAGSNIVTVPSTADLVVGQAITGPGLPANQVITGITSGTTFTISTGTGVTAQSGGTLTATSSNTIAVNTSGALAGVVVFPTGGLTINNANVTASAAAQIAPTNTVTINGGGTLTLTGDNTLGGLVFNNNGGTQATPTVTPSGTLTLTNGVTATSSNPSTTSTIAGKVALGSGQHVFSISPILAGSVNIAPTQASFILQAASGAGGINKTGAGILQFNTQDTFTGAINVQGGGIQYGAGNAGSRFSAVNLTGTSGATTFLNLAGNSTTIGTLSGDANSIVSNSSSTGATLTIGYGQTQASDSSTFAGRFLRAGDGIANSLNIVKLGPGSLIFTGNGNTTTGTLSVQIGKVIYRGNGGSTFSNNTVVTGGELTLDNSATNVNNRFGGNITNSTLTMSGGTVNLIGNGAANTLETIDTLTVTNGSSVLNLQPNANSQLDLNVVTSFSGVSGGGTLYIKNLSSSQGQGLATIGGNALNINAPAGFGVGFPVSDLPIRPDMIADDGNGNFGFVTKDSSSGLLRLLDPTIDEVITSLTSGSATPTNYLLSSNQQISENTTAYSLVLQNSAGIASTAPANFGRFSQNGTLLSQVVLSGGILVPTSTTATPNSSTITVPLLTTGQNVPLTFHVLDQSSLTVNGDVAAGTAGLTKSGTGTLTLNSRGFYTGATTINEGILNLNGGRKNAIAVQPTTGAATLSALNVNGGTFNLGGNSQSFGQLASNNPNPGYGGTITSTNAATLTTATNNSPTFAGVIAGALSFEKVGSGTQVLTGISTYTGNTVIRGGTLSLRDQGQLLNTSDLTAYYGTLTIDNSGATSTGAFNLKRIPDAAPVKLLGGSLTLQAGGSADYSATLSTPVTILGGANSINANDSTGATSFLSLGSFTRSDTTSTVNFTGSSLGNASGFISKISFNTTPTLTNNIIGPWAIVNGNDYASYTGSGSAGRIGGLSNTGNGFANYNTAITTTTLASAVPTDNVSIGSSATLASNASMNVLRINQTGAVSTLTQTGGTSLTLNGFLANGAVTIGSVPNEGTLTSAGSSIYAYVNSTSTVNSVVFNSTVNSAIVNGSGGPLQFIKSGGQPLVLAGNNTYTGGTVVNQGTLFLSNVNANGTTVTTIPSSASGPDLTIAGGATVTQTTAGQLKTSAVVNLDGSGTMNFVSTNTIGGLTFNNRGGGSSPIVNTAANLTLGAAAAINSVNDSLVLTPVIAGTSLSFGSANPVITTSGQAATHLQITAPIHSSAGVISKAGAGLLGLNPTVSLVGNGGIGNDTVSNLTDLGLAIGMSVSGPGVPVGTTVIDLLSPGGGSVRLSNQLTANTTAGSFVFSGSTFANGFKVSGANAGGIVVGASSVMSGNSIINGPLGTGDLTLQDQGAILSDGTIRTLNNRVIAPNDFVIGTPIGSLNSTALAGNAVNFAGNILLADNVSHTVTVTGQANVSTFFGALVGNNAPLVKAGLGTLVLANATNGATWSGSFGITSGVLRNGADGAIPGGSVVSVASGGVMDLGGVDLVLSQVTGTGVVGSSSGAFTTLYLGGTTSTDTTSAIDSTFAGSIAGVADNGLVGSPKLNLTKVGSGTLSLTGQNTITGTGTVNSGTLAIGNTGLTQISGTFVVNGLDPADVGTGKIGAKLVIDGKISGTVSSGKLNASGIDATVGGHGIIDVNTTIGDQSILAPSADVGSSLTINDGHSLELSNGAVMLFTARQAQTGKVIIADPGSSLSLPSTWTLKLQNLDVQSPSLLDLVIFDGQSTSPLNGFDTFTTMVNSVSVDFGTTGWSFGPGGGVFYKSNTNDIVLMGVVPEPSTGLLLIGALGGAFGFRRLRRRG